MKAVVSAPILRSARVLLGAVFVYTGTVKALDPVDFLKSVHAYQLVETALVLNLIAALLPWLEVFCGLLLVLGVKARAAAVVQGALLTGFTAILLIRAFTLARAGGTGPFYLVRFDCGCGIGEITVWAKLLENAGLILLTTLVAGARQAPASCHPQPPASPYEVRS